MTPLTLAPVLDPHLRDVDTGERMELDEIDFLDTVGRTCGCCAGCPEWPCGACRAGGVCDGCSCEGDERGVAGDRCEVGNECGRLGCPECQQ